MDTRLLLDAPGQPTSRIQIAAIGSYKHKAYGDFDITADEVRDWQTNLSVLPGGRALIDLDHRADRSPRNTEAAGWITGIDLDGDKVWGNVEWTDIGRSAIESKRYLFFSPSYGRFTDETGTTTPNTLFGGALTNKPHLSRMATVSLASPERVELADEQYVYADLYLLDVSQDERNLAVKEGNALPDGSYPIRNTGQLHAAAHLAATGHGNVQGARKLIKRRAKELGVPLTSLPGFEDADGDADSQHAMALSPDTLKLLDLDDTADEATVEAAIVKALEAATKPVETDETVKTLEAEVKDRDQRIVTLETAVTKLEQLHDKLTAERAAEAFDAAFTKAVREGRTVEAQRERYEKFYALDADATTELLAQTPQIVQMKGSGWDNTRMNPEAVEEPAGTTGYQLDAMVQAYIERTDGLSARDYPKVMAQYARGEIAL